MQRTSKVFDSFISFAVLLVALVALCGPAAYGQQLTGTITGTAYDQAGAIIPNAQIEIKNEASGDVRRTVTNSAGNFTVTALQAGSYAVTVTAPGFTRWEQQGIVVNQGDTRTLPNIALKVGTVSEKIEVVSQTESIAPLDTAEVSQTLSTSMLNQIQIQGRDAGELLKIMPGMAYNNGLNAGNAFSESHSVGSNTGPVGNFSANGTQPYGAMSYMLDGANLVDPGNVGTQIANINADMTAEVKVLMSSYGAEFAKGPVVFQAIGKSGGRDFHGEAYGYFRNSAMNSLDSAQKDLGATRENMPQEHYYYGGGNIGGPILLPFVHWNRNRNRLFFWVGYEYMDQVPAGSIDRYVVPTSDMLQGNFSPSVLAPFMNAAGTPIQPGWAASLNAPGSCASWQNCSGYGIVNGQIPQANFDKNGAILLGLLPKPNVNPASGGDGYNYEFVNPGGSGVFLVPTNRWEQTEKIDYAISDNTKLTVSYTYQKEADAHPIATWWAPNQAVPYPTNMPADTPSDVIMGNFTHVFSPTLVNELVVTYARYTNELSLTNPSAIDPSALGMQAYGLFGVSEKQIPNTLSWSGLAEFMPQADFYGGPAGVFGAVKSDPAVYDNITKVIKSHTLKFGFYWDQNQNAQNDLLGGINSAGVEGQYEFETYSSKSTNNTIADELLGIVNAYGQPNKDPVGTFQYHQVSAYAADQWKATRRLTLNLGLRFDHVGQYYDPTSPGFYVWNPAVYSNAPNAPANTGLQTHATNSAIPVSGNISPFVYYLPRLGAAYDIFGNGKTVLRGGYAVFKYQAGVNSAQSNDSGTGAFNYVSPVQFNGLTNTLALTGVPTSAGALNGGTITAETLGDNKVPATRDWNFTLSQAVPWHSFLELSYVGNHSYDGILTNGTSGGLEDANAIQPGVLFKPDPVDGLVHCIQGQTCSANFAPGGSLNLQDYRPFANYQDIYLVNHGSYANYNSFQASWQKATAKSFIMANYTFGKVMGIRDGYSGDGAAAGAIVNTFNLASNYGTLAYDHRQILNLAYVYHLPSPVHGNFLEKGVVNGWVISGVTSYQSGVPIQPNTTGNLNVVYAGNGMSNESYLGTNDIELEPLVICNPMANLKPGQYFNPSCFAPPAAGQQGTVIWPNITGPGSFNSDLSVFKDFHISESRYIEFRLEAFNFLNHPNPAFGAGGQTQDETLQFYVQGHNTLWSPTNTNPLMTGSPLYAVGYRSVQAAVKFYF